MQKRFLLFMVLFFATITSYYLFVQWLYPPRPPVPGAPAPPAGVAAQAKAVPDKGAAAEPGKPPAAAPAVKAGEKPTVKAAPKAAAAPTYFTLGSLAPQGGTRMLVTVTDRGAAVVRIELNSPRYRALEDSQQQDRGGYLGHLCPADDPAGGARVQVVGPGTPAADAQLRPGDVITAVDQQRVRHAADLEPAVARFAPGDKVSLEIQRAGAAMKLPATLIRRPLQMIRPEWESEPVEVLTSGKHDPLSLLLTLSTVGSHVLRADEEQEIDGTELKDQNWDVVNHAPDSIELRRSLPDYHLIVTKRYRIAKVPHADVGDDTYCAYHLLLDIEIARDADAPLEVAYRLDGPNGLPTEGWWYLNKISRNWWQGAGARDVALHFAEYGPELMGGPEITATASKGKLGPWELKKTPSDDHSPLKSLGYIGVDTQYFSAILIPQKPLDDSRWYSRVEPRLVLGPDTHIGEIVATDGNKLTATVAGESQSYEVNNDTRIVIDGATARLADLKEKQQVVVTVEKQQNALVAKTIIVPRTQLSNVSCRLTSEPVAIARGKPLTHSYMLFAGPKDRQLLSQYGPEKALDEINLSELIYYGWPIWGWFAKPLAYVLHFFAGLGNYGLAIVLLTVTVRLGMFPISRKQALGAQKMQALQPEIKRISELYKKDFEKRSRAMQELQKKHNYRPLSGCLPVFIQLPIFIGLYRALMTDINLRQAPLITESLGWCTNLAAPDMLWYWAPYLPAFITSPTGRLLVLPSLGPYLNILPLVTVALYIWQQILFMPPAADEQAAMQQKMMRYMLILMGFMFFRVPSGLCLYFIATTLWGIGERKLLPTMAVPVAGGAPPARPVEKPPASNGSPESAAKRRRKQRGKN